MRIAASSREIIFAKNSGVSLLRGTSSGIGLRSVYIYISQSCKQKSTETVICNVGHIRLHNFCEILVKGNDFRFLSRVGLVQSMNFAIISFEMAVDYEVSSTISIVFCQYALSQNFKAYFLLSSLLPDVLF